VYVDAKHHRIKILSALVQLSYEYLQVRRKFRVVRAETCSKERFSRTFSGDPKSFNDVHWNESATTS